MNWLRAAITSFVMLIGYSRVTFASSVETFEIDDFPTALGSCDAAKALLQNRFASLSAVSVVNASCERDPVYANRLTVRVTYSSGSPLYIRDTNDVLYAGYPSYDACVQDSQRQLDMFRRFTRIEPLLSYCNVDGELKLFYVGHPQWQRFVADMTLGDMALDPAIPDSADLARQVAAAAAGAGINVSRVFVRRDHVVLYYYATESEPIGAASFPSFENQDSCESNRDRTRSFFQSLGVKSLVDFCSVDQIFANGTSTFYLVGVQPGAFPFMGRLDLPNEVTPDSYSSYESCMADRARILSINQQRSDASFRAALCTVPNDRIPGDNRPITYSVMLFQ